MNDQLLPCPLCGKPPRFVPADYIHNDGRPWPFAECNSCHVGAPVEFWNTRAQPASEPKPFTDHAFIRGWLVGCTYFGIRREAVKFIQTGQAEAAGNGTELHPLYFANPAPAVAAHVADFAGFLIDNHELREITEERMHHWLYEYVNLKNPEQQP